MGVLEAKLFITAKDETGAAFKAIEERVERLAKMIGKVERLGAAASGLEASATMAVGFERAERAAAAMAAAMEKAQGAIGAATARMERLSTQAQRAERHVSTLGRVMHGVQHVTREVSPLVMGGAGFGMLEETKRATEAGAELQHERVAARNAGRTPEEIAAFEAKAHDVATRVPTASYPESMKTLLETTSAFGSPEHAIEHLEFMMRTAAVLKAASGGKIDESAGEMGQQFAKFFEMRGVANDPKRFEMEGDEMVRAMAASGGTFNPREMRLFGVQAKAALRNYDLEYLSRYVPSLVGETGGERAGTAANAFNNTILGKAHDAKQAEAWMKYGLLDPTKVDKKSGHVVSWSAGAVKDTDLAMANPLKWFETVALPAMRAKGVNTDDAKELTKALAVMFRNSMANQWANENSQPADRLRLHKDAGLIGQTEMPDAMYKRNLEEDPGQALSAFSASINSFSSALTVPIMKNAAGVMDAMAHSIAGWAQSLSSWQKANPEMAKMLGAGAITGGLVGGGALGYGALSGLAGGFGLKGSANDLSGAAHQLDAAAERLGASGKPGVTGDQKGASSGLGGRGLLAALGLGGLALGAPTPDDHGVLRPPLADKVDAFNAWFKETMPWWLQPGAGIPAPHAAISPVQPPPLSMMPVGPSESPAYKAGFEAYRNAVGAKPFDPDQLSGKIEAKVTPDQISAKVEGQVQGSVAIKVDASPELKATIAAAKGGSDRQFDLRVGGGAPDTKPGGRRP